MDITDQVAEPASADRKALVAKLKRAASLPRLADGRRPPMHVEAVSEGEQRQHQQDESRDTTDNDTPPVAQAKSTDGPDTERELEPENVHTPVEPTTRAAKRRSRSRSRSRGSKDMRGKNKPIRSPTPNPTVTGDSSPDEATPSQPYVPLPPVLSPIPSHFTDLQRSQLLRSPVLAISPEPSVGYPGTSPPTPMLPSLEALQKGLFRSNSAGSVSVGRMMAMHKLTGGTDRYEPTSPSSPLASPSPFPSLGRNNTVSGGERSAARQNMLSRLGGRITRETDGSGEDGVALPPLTPKRRRRRSRKSSGGANTSGAESSSQAAVDLSFDTPVVPPAPLPVFSKSPDYRSRSATPNHVSSPESASPVPHELPSAPNHVNEQEQHPERIERPRRRSVVVEEEEDDESRPLYPGLPATPKRLTSLRMPHGSDAPSYGSGSTDSASPSAVGVPVYFSATQATPSRQELFPTSPFPTPLKETITRDDDEEQVLYPAESHRLRPSYEDREISWVASPVPQIRDLVDDDSDSEHSEEAQEVEIEHGVEIEEFDDGDQPPSSPSSPRENVYDDSSPRASANSKLVVESETSPEIMPSYGPHSPSSIATFSHTRDSLSPPLYPARLSVASRMLNDRSPLNGDVGDRDDRSPTPAESSRRNGDNSSTSAWEKLKITFSRSASSNGRRSRTNSLVARERRDYDSSASRESGGSLTSPKFEPNVQQQAQQQPFAQLASASASASSLGAHASPIPPNSSVDLAKYQDSKLFPFPGMKTLQAQRSRNNGFASASNPDVTYLSNTTNEDQSPHASTGSTSTPQHSDVAVEVRTVVHQVSDSHLLGKYGLNSPLPSAGPPRTDYFNITPHSHPPPLNGSKLPMNLPGVKQWLSRNKLFSSTATSPTSSGSSPSSPPVTQPRVITKKSSLSDLLHLRKASPDIDWEGLAEDKSRTPTGASSHLPLDSKQTLAVDVPRAEEAFPAFAVPYNDTDATVKGKKAAPVFVEETEPSYTHFRTSSTQVSPYEHPSSTTPDPTSSLDDGPAQWTSDSSSTSSSHSFLHPMQSQGQVVIERLEENLARGSKSPMWSSAIDEPPRKLILSSPVLQVVNPNTVKDRFLFLFTDILVIAKPVIHEQDNIMDSYRSNPVDRKFIVKNVVLLKNLRFSGDRVEPQPKSTSYAVPPRNPLIRQFVHQFAMKDVDSAISTLFEKSGVVDDHVVLGQLLFKTLDLDRTRLGDYLSRRTSKLVLKTYLDGFGFTGLRLDTALRVFLHSINIPSKTAHNSNNSPLEYLLDTFAGRWYEANAGIVAYDKDLATRLVRALVQLNDMIHNSGGISQESGSTHIPRGQKVSSRDFVDAFRRYDTRFLVSDDSLESIYHSITEDKLQQAPHSASQTFAIMIKRALPTRLTYKVQSDPIVLRIPQADPQLSIALYGQDLVFDPPVVTFSRSSEASFRVMGTSLGPKTMIMCRSGPNAVNYAGLPLSTSLLVERAFMRNTFQVAFPNHRDVKRRYMFSVDDPLIRHQWTVSLKQQIDSNVSLSTAGLGAISPGASKFHRAAEHIAFKVLQETLIGASDIPPAVAIDHALRSLNASDSSQQNINGNKASRFGSTARTQGLGAVHVRSKSRSQVYHRLGAGQNELDLNRSMIDSRDSQETGLDSRTDSYTNSFDLHDHPRVDDRLWSSRDLEMQCQQNSSIALVLSFMQVGSP